MEFVTRNAARSAVDQSDLVPQTVKRGTVAVTSEEGLSQETTAADDASKLVHELFEQQVLRTPRAKAVMNQSEEITYEQLNSRSNQLARYLLDRGARPDEPIAICMERGIDLIVGLLAILKAGSCYVPLDPSYPLDRLTFMLRDATARLLLTHEKTASILEHYASEIIVVDREWITISRRSTENIPVAQLGVGSRNLALIIYTSGSTGLPKGAMNEHRGVVNRVFAQRVIEGFLSDEVCAQKTSISFVDSVFEIFGAVCNGVRLVVVPTQAVIDFRLMARLVETYRVTRLTTVPSLARSMLESDSVMGQLSTLKSWTLSGEEVKPELVEKLQRSLPLCQLIVLYGASEISSDATYYRISGSHDVRVPVGLPVPNVHAWTADAAGNAVPAGAAGEICVGGVGVGRGYWNRPDLTAERFVAEVAPGDDGARLYKTGDIGRLRQDGLLECIGRVDRQVKIRGFRIELPEIERHLGQCPGVHWGIVVARQDSHDERYLVAYVIPERSVGEVQASDRRKIRNELRRRLPDYMIPRMFVLLEEFPFTPNGKLDRMRLPAPSAQDVVGREYEPPREGAERQLAEVWESLLRTGEVGRRDNFFELGGHSLLIVKMLEALKLRGLHVEAYQAFASRTLAELAALIVSEDPHVSRTGESRIPLGCTKIVPDMVPLVNLTEQQIESIVDTLPGGARNVQDIYPLLPLQEGILFHHLLAVDKDEYILSTLLRIESSERLDAFITALQRVIDRHDALRTAIFWEGSPSPVQVVCRKVPLHVEHADLNRESTARTTSTDFDLTSPKRINLQVPPLVGLRIARFSSNEPIYVQLWMHHIICDQIAYDTIVSEVTTLLSEKEGELPKAQRYRAYVERALAHQRAAESEGFFNRLLGGISETTAPFGLVATHEEEGGIKSAILEAPEGFGKEVFRCAEATGVGTATLVHAAWAIATAASTGRADVVYGTVLLSEDLGINGYEGTVGLFINTLPVRLDLRNMNAFSLVSETHSQLAQLIRYQPVPLVTAQRSADLPSGSALFTALLNYRRMGELSSLQFSAADGLVVLELGEASNYPITLSVDDYGGRLTFSVQTRHGLDPNRVLKYLEHALSNLVKALIEFPQISALALASLPDDELQWVLSNNPPRAPLPMGSTSVHRMFEEQVARTPFATAVVFGEHSLTYAQLNERANLLADWLRINGVIPGDVVGVCVDRSDTTIAGVIAVLKAGAAYLPLDPSYPADRLRYMVADARPRVILLQQGNRRIFSGIDLTLMFVEEFTATGVESKQGSFASHTRDQDPNSWVYVIYTSGSTGRPKGIAMGHSALANLLQWHRQSLEPGEACRTLQFAALSFDVAFQEIFTTLTGGGTLVLIDEWTRKDFRALLTFIIDKRIGRLFIPPLVLHGIAEAVSESETPPPELRDIFVAGEQLRVEVDVKKWLVGASSPRLHNHYGPSETHVVTALTLQGHSQEWPTLPPIGRPIRNVEIYILNAALQLVPVGLPGEVYIGGDALADGYLGRSDLTAERFLADPFNTLVGARMYKTGDVGKWNPDGTVEFLGRNDEQVKIRGHRIELGEIESRLVSQTGVAEAAVIAKQDTHGRKRLVAYFTLREGFSVGPEQLRDGLAQQLPEYMVPSAFVRMERLPLTPSGKLSRRQLPVPDKDAYVEDKYISPQGEMEELIAEVWNEALHVGRVGRDDNFFMLGGHSITAMQVISRIRAILPIQMSVRLLFDFPALRDFSAELERIQEEELLAELAEGGDSVRLLVEKLGGSL